MTRAVIGVMTAVVLGVTLSLGLWPFHSPRNNARWLENCNGLSFDAYGTALSSRSRQPSITDPIQGNSVEAWVQAEPYHFYSFLSFYVPNASVLSLRETLTDFEFVEYLGGARSRGSLRLAVNEAFRSRRPVFVAVTTVAARTRLYVDGVLRVQASDFRVSPGAFDGQIILGDAPLHPDGWRGEIRGLAIYGSELSAEQVLAHYHTWTNQGQPEVTIAERITHLYLMNEHSGNLVRDAGKPSDELIIPERYTVVDKVALEPFWNEFELTRNYGRAIVKNIIGFVPMGSCMYLLLNSLRRPRPITSTIISGFLVSLAIEVLQILLPTRDSGTTDLVTNTVGTSIGALTTHLLASSRRYQ